MPRTCILLGASGLVGGHLLRLLDADTAYGEVRAFTRRALGLGARPRVREVLVDFDDPASYRDQVAVDDVFCCLGTTIKKAGSQEAFRKVDFEAPVAIARASRAAGASRYVIVTAVGADPGSSIFYNRVKGETEAALRELDFPRGLSIVRPSMLLGDRTESRPAERFTAALMKATRPLFAGGLARYRAIDAADVARAMHVLAAHEEHGAKVYEGGDLFALVAAALPGPRTAPGSRGPNGSSPSSSA
jgi:uncharacterized protein YbjT (DUF2867 family)